MLLKRSLFLIIWGTMNASFFTILSNIKLKLIYSCLLPESLKKMMNQFNLFPIKSPTEASK